MISRLTGKLIEKQPPQIVIDVNGVAYEADVSMQTFYNLPPLNETVQLYTQLVVREDAHLLFGFGTVVERATFRQLVKVSGIGAKTALGILSAMTADELAQAVAQEDVQRLSSAPGIGKKTAERVVVDLSDKVGLPTHYGRANEPVQTELNTSDEALEALMALGYTLADATKALENVDVNLPTAQRVMMALKS